MTPAKRTCPVCRVRHDSGGNQCVDCWNRFAHGSTVLDGIALDPERLYLIDKAMAFGARRARAFERRRRK